MECAEKAFVAMARRNPIHHSVAKELVIRLGVIVSMDVSKVIHEKVSLENMVQTWRACHQTSSIQYEMLFWIKSESNDSPLSFPLFKIY